MSLDLGDVTFSKNVKGWLGLPRLALQKEALFTDFSNGESSNTLQLSRSQPVPNPGTANCAIGYPLRSNTLREV